MASSSAASAQLFAYGTLMFREVFTAVCGVSRPLQEATLTNYARYAVRDQPFPGLVPLAGGSVVGCLITGIGADLWTRLDRFEGDFYDRVGVTVRCADGHDAPAQTYVVRASERTHLTNDGWCATYFRVNELERYVTRVN